MPFYIKYGMGGGYGGSGDWEQVDCTSEMNALLLAQQLAEECYESYEGAGGLFDLEEFLENNENASDQECEEARRDDMDSWLEYEARWFEEDPNE